MTSVSGEDRLIRCRADAAASRADLALAEKDNSRARKLAEQAEVDAGLAEVKARSLNAQKAAAVSDENIRILREELNRKSQ